MKLNHLDLQVSDVQGAVSFFEAHFGMRLTTSRSSPAIAILTDAPDPADARHGAGPHASHDPHDAFVLVLQRKKDERAAYPEGFHLGFLVDDVAKVEAVHRSLVAAGADVSPIETNNRGTMIYCRHTDGILVEVSCRKKQ